jgi:hypothetical protein
MEFGKPKKLLCEMGIQTRAKFLAVDILGFTHSRKPLMLTYGGETHSISKWASMYGLKVWTLRKRVINGWKGDELFQPAKKSRTRQQVLEEKIAVKAEKLRRKEHKFKVDLAIIKVLRMRESRNSKIDNILDYQESIHYAIARVLEMRKSRANRMRLAA